MNIAIVADDLTGAADAGVQFCPYLGPIYMTGGERANLGSADIQAKGISVFTNTRSSSPERAADSVRQVTKVIQQLNPDVVYKKIDSCLRGNLGSELDAMLSALHASVSFISPALPEQGRTTVNDCHRINGIPVNETEIGMDPLCPVNESRISVLLATQSRMSVGHISLRYLEEGIDALSEQVKKLLMRGCRHIVFDAQKTRHLDAIATLSRNGFGKVLLVGSAGLANSLARTMARQPAPKAKVDRPQLKKWLFVCGSASQVMAEQASMLAQSTGWSHMIIDPDILAAGGTSTEFKSLLAELETSWHTESLIVSIDKNCAGNMSKKPDRIVEGVTDMVSSLVSVTAPDGIFLSGGDTAERVLHEIDCSATLLHEEILPGLVHGEIAGGSLNGLPVFTKPGAFGQPDILIQLLKALTTDIAHLNREDNRNDDYTATTHTGHHHGRSRRHWS